MVHDEVYKCCRGPTCKHSQTVFSEDLTKYDTDYNSILVKVRALDTPLTVKIQQSDTSLFTTYQEVTFNVAANTWEDKVVPVRLHHVRYIVEAQDPAVKQFDYLFCRKLRVCCADEVDPLDGILVWLEAIFGAIDGLELSVDHIDIDMDDVETLITATNVLLTAISAGNVITGQPSTQVIITGVSQVALGANANRKYASFVNLSGNPMALGFGAAAVANTGIVLLKKGSSYEITPTNMFRGEVRVIGTNGDLLGVTEGV